MVPRDKGARQPQTVEHHFRTAGHSGAAILRRDERRRYKEGRDVTVRTTAPAVEWGAGWPRAFLDRASGMIFDDEQLAQIAAQAERKLVDLFDVAEETAVANGRAPSFGSA